MKKFEEAELKVMMVENSVICTSGCSDPTCGGNYDQGTNSKPPV